MDEIIDYVMETPGNTNPNVLRGMLNNSGGNLPPVTSDDNGDVLTVVSGEWAKAAPSGGGASALIVTANASGILDHTWQEIHDAAPLVWLKKSQGVNIYYPLAGEGVTEGVYVVAFDGVLDDIAKSYMADSADGYPESSK